MSWSRIATIIVAVFAVGVTCLPMDIPATDLMPRKLTNEPTLATELLPPENGAVSEWSPDNVAVPSTDLAAPEQNNEKKQTAMLFVINVIAVRNTTAEDSNDVLHNDVIEQVPSEVAVPLALFLLVIEDEDENHPVSLDDVAKDLEKEGFAVEKVVKDGETRLVRVDLDSIESTVRIPADANDSRNILGEETAVEETGKLTSVRRKRHICLHCKLEELKEKIHNKHHGGGYGGGYGGGCGGGCGGGGYYPQPVQIQPVYQQPIYQQPIYQPPPQQHYQPPQQHYPPPQQYYPPQQTCNTCQGGGGGYGNGGGQAYAQASAQASASSSSGGYGR